MKDEYLKLQSEMNQKAVDNLQTADGMHNFLEHTLNNFAYRYMLDDKNAEPKSALVAENTFMVQTTSSNMKEALKNENQFIRDGIVKMIQELGMKEAKIQSSLSIKVISDKQVELASSLNWNAPSFQFNESKIMLKTLTYQFEDVLELRNNLALKCEEVCEIF